MDKQKQIEELTKDLYRIQTYAIMDIYPCAQKQPNELVAEHLVGYGYNKIPEGALVLTKEYYESEAYTRLIENELCKKCRERLAEAFDKALEPFRLEIIALSKELVQTRKETAEKIATEFHERVNERRSFSLDMMKNSTCDMAQYWNGKINEQSCVRVDIDEICKKFTGETK